MKIYIILCILFFLLFLPKNVFAIEDPLSVPNNKVGIHILFPTEIDQAANLVNGNGGDWGYVTIPIQAGDRDLLKWQKFMDDARRLHIIPIIRVATEGDYFNTKVWRKPNYNDILDFANFLNSLQWPTVNRYVIVFNEVNRSDEWGGSTNPTEYAQMLQYAATVFKSVNPDFFIISAGLDNAANTTAETSYNEYEFMNLMNQAVPGIFNQIDGIASHSYPNPLFAQPPTMRGRTSVASFRFEKSLAESMSNKTLPVFITETGWSRNYVNQNTIAQYSIDAFTQVWNDPSVVAVTPFLLSASAGSFVQFSFLDLANIPTPQYLAIRQLPKQPGSPKLTEEVLSVNTTFSPIIKSFSAEQPTIQNNFTVPLGLKIFLKWLLKIE